MNQEIAIPLAYFITFSCYGTWLHGEKNTSVDRHNKIHGTYFLPSDPKRARIVKAQMKEQAYFLDESRRVIVLNAIKMVCAYRQWSLLAAHVRTNHVHLVVDAQNPANQVLNSSKSYASRYLNEAQYDINRKNRWTRHGSTLYLWKREEVEATIRYVIHDPR